LWQQRKVQSEQTRLLQEEKDHQEQLQALQQDEHKAQASLQQSPADGCGAKLGRVSKT